MTKLFLSLDDAVRVAVREFDLGDFIEFGKKAFGVELTFKKSDNPDTYEKLFGISQEAKTGHWIAVSERLPKIRQDVLCQCRGNNYSVLRLNHDSDWECIYPRTTYMQSFVIAWMPLPEPFEPQESEVKE